MPISEEMHMARLVVNPGSPTAWEIELKAGADTIGRGFANDFKISDPSVSGSHCRIIIDSGNVIIKDLGSTNGTFINRAPVTEATLLPGQTIHLGGVEMLFRADAPADAPVALPARVARLAPTIAVVPPPLPQNAPPPVQRAAPAVPPPAALNESHNCKFHPKTVARYFCNKCNLAFCELCVTSRSVGAAMHKFCRRCGTECLQLQVTAPRPAGSQNFYRRLPGAFTYPVRGAGVFVLIVCTIVISALDFLRPHQIYFSTFFVILIIAAIFILMSFFGYLFSFMQNIIHSTAAGDEEMPGWPPFDGLAGCFFQLAGAVVFAFGIAIALYCVAVFGEQPAAGIYIIPALVLGCLYFPMALLAVAMKDSPLAANPLVVVPAIFKVPLEYLVTVVVLAMVMGIRALGEPLISSVFPRGLTTHSMPKLFAYLGAEAFWKLAAVYLLAVNMRILGLLYLTKKQKLGWFDH